MKVQSGLLAVATAFVMISGACSSSPSGSSGAGGTSSTGKGGGTGGSSSTGKAGTSGSSSSGGTGGGASCPNGTACGGNAVGTWTVSSSCLTLSDENLDITLAGLDPTSCKNVTIAGSLAVTGTWTTKSDGTYTDGTTTSGTAQLQLPAGCLQLSGTTTTCQRISGPLAGLGFASVTCTDATGGGCTCAATVDQMGGLGLLTADPQTNGNYTTSGSTLTNDTTANYSYCVAGNQLTLTPQPTSPTTTGTIVLQNGGTTTGTAGTSGTGVAGTTGTGAAGTNGAAGRGGTTGTAGTTGTGTAGTNGAAGKGGTTGTAGTNGTAGTTGAGGATTAAQGPCDIYSAAGQPCAAAYSMIRVLSKAYSGPLYQVRSGSSSMNTGSGGATKDIDSVGGFADTATQDTFCTGTTCTVSVLYDQSGNGNNLKSAPAGLSGGGTYAAMPDFESSATKDSIMVGGHKVYALYMNAREGYRTAVGVKGKNMPTGTNPQGIYELADGTHSGTACCWDFGNVSTDPTVYGVMNTVFFGTGFWGTGAGSGPWFMGDFEGGVWA
ncbi:MAG TPA: arabinofuranosidase catalytic domain-containing protein, partial [Polyangia bacterium]|nr:arabinofuranosidase catalytic domain-containing protein [Polyangia bacterium]